MSKHTPGPWDRRYFDDAKVIVVGPKKGQGTKRTLVATLTGPEREANGNLLVAAPDLLAALTTAIEVMKDHYVDEAIAAEFEVFTDAVAKAHGGEA